MKIFSLGEALIDLIPLDAENMTFQKILEVLLPMSLSDSLD